MVDVKELMNEVIRRSNCVDTSSVNEIEEIVDTGLEKNEENIQKVAFEYLDEKGYSHRLENLDRAKQHIAESSANSDTVRVRKRREMVEDLLSELDDDEMNKLLEICTLDSIIKLNGKVDALVNRRYEYAVEAVDEILLDSEKGSGSLAEFVSFQMLLNKYAEQGYRVASITTRETANHGKSLPGFSSSNKQTVVVFEREVL